jgi:D-lyxose ketol-isomerase
MTDRISRRQLLSAAATSALVASTAGVASAQQPRQREQRGQRRSRQMPTFDNASFYKNGKFSEENAKDAIIALCRYHGYPVFPGLRENLWVFDYGLGEYAKLGLACYMYSNHVAGPYSYMFSNLFLLPHQMLPEHWHEAPDNKDCAQKDEGWAIHWGRSYVVGEGTANLPSEVVIPKIHCNGTVTVSHCVVADPGTFVPLSKVGTRHWQYGGSEGVILTEVAICHDNAAVRHSDPACNKAFLDG